MIIEKLENLDGIREDDIIKTKNISADYSAGETEMGQVIERKNQSAVFFVQYKDDSSGKPFEHYHLLFVDDLRKGKLYEGTYYYQKPNITPGIRTKLIENSALLEEMKKNFMEAMKK